MTAPIVKVTECKGWHRAPETDEIYCPGSRCIDLTSLLPNEARRRREGELAAMGRFRITVEFWPDEPAKAGE